MGMLRPQSGVGGPFIDNVVFHSQHTELIFDIAISPFLRVVVGVIRQARNKIDARNVDAHRATVEGFFLIAKVKRAAHPFAAIIEPYGGQRGSALITLHRRLAFAVHQIHPRAELVVVAKAAAQIQRTADLRIRGIVDAHASGRGIFRALRLQVDHPADAGAGRTVKQRVGTFKNFDPLKHGGIHHLTRHHARQPAQGHIVAVKFKAANAVGLGVVTVALHWLNPGIVADHIGDGFRLLILDKLRGIADDAKRNVHRVLFAEHPKTAAVGYLTIEIGGHHQIAAGFKIAGGCGLNDHRFFAFLAFGDVFRRRCRMGDSANG